MLYKLTGTLNFALVASRLETMKDESSIVIISMVFLVAFGAKAALVLLIIPMLP